LAFSAVVEANEYRADCVDLETGVSRADMPLMGPEASNTEHPKRDWPVSKTVDLTSGELDSVT
jgi:hypothetical protein